MADRDANRGDCAQPCRWKYRVLEEEKRPNKFMPYEEDEKGSYIFNVNDMCQIDKIAELVDSGVQSFKIEGRMKSLYYITCITKIYREAIDLYLKSPADYAAQIPYFLEEVNKLNNRGYTHGFYFGEPDVTDYNYNGEFDQITHYFVGQVLDAKILKVLTKNNINVGDELELFMPKKRVNVKIKSIYSLKTNENIEKAYPGLEIIVEFEEKVEIEEYAILRA
jgi:putative protease